MKNLIAALVVCVALATTSFDADAAKRFGGGASFGKAAPTFSRRLQHSLELIKLSPRRLRHQHQHKNHP